MKFTKIKALCKAEKHCLIYKQGGANPDRNAQRGVSGGRTGDLAQEHQDAV